MASVHNFVFDAMTRGGSDSCAMSQQNVQNLKAGNYMLTQFRPDCPMGSAMNVALNQPSVFYKGSNTVGIGGSNVDDYSALVFGDVKSRPKCKISLFQRPFATVPYLGRGPSNPVLESQIQQGSLVDNRKSVNTLMEKSFSDKKNYPLIPSLQATVQNPANLVEGAAAEGWIRGGLPSRDQARNDTQLPAELPSQDKSWFDF